MSFTTFLAAPVFFVRWGTPELKDVTSVEAALASFASRIKRKPFYVAIIPADSEAPSPAVRREMTSRMDAVLEKAEQVHFVIEGTGFRNSMLRSALAGILLVGGKKGRVFVHSKVEEALASLAHPSGINPDRAAREAVEAGVHVPR